LKLNESIVSVNEDYFGPKQQFFGQANG
jgi:hypothetical protein